MYLNFLIIQKTKEIKFHNEIFIEEKIDKAIHRYNTSNYSSLHPRKSLLNDIYIYISTINTPTKNIEEFARYIKRGQRCKRENGALIRRP